MKIEFSKREKGITLIALIITIIILLILAGVTIGTLSRTGIFNKAKQTASTYSEKKAEEDVSLLLKEWMMDNAGNGITLDDYLNKKVQAQLIEIDDSVNEEDSSKIGIIKDKYVVTVDKNGNIIETQKVGPKPTIDSSSIKITLQDGTEIEDRSQELGTRLKVTFNTSMENGTITKVEVVSSNPVVQAELQQVDGVTKASYITNGTDKTIKFKIYGKVEGEEYTSNKQISVENKYERTITANSLLKAIGDNSFENDSYEKIQVDGVNGSEIYQVHVYNFNGNQTWNENKTFGTESDVSTTVNGTRQYAKNMVVVKVNGDLTIDNGVNVGPYYNETTGYGGPKGFMLYVTGKITNNGTIDNSHGAYAVGQNVSLFKNANSSFEFVPDVNNGSKRSTGNGGDGFDWNSKGTSGHGGTGTSFSGGAGGGGSRGGAGTDGSSVGGPGGNGPLGTQGYGGSGNPGGLMAGRDVISGTNGTGGLLIIYADVISGNGNYTAIGTDGKGQNYCGGGGASGGGSINIFYNTSEVAEFNYNVNGGTGSQTGTTGGNGHFTAGSIATGSFVNNN